MQVFCEFRFLETVIRLTKPPRRGNRQADLRASTLEGYDGPVDSTGKLREATPLLPFRVLACEHVSDLL